MSISRPGDDVIEGQLRAIERERLGSLVTPDLQLAQRLHADDYELITPGGATMTRRDYLDAIGSGELVYRAFEPVSEIRVRAHEVNSGICTCGVHPAGNRPI